MAVALIFTAISVGEAWRADASPGDVDTTFVPITACRLIDTRPPSLRVGPFSTWGPGETKVVQATGSNGDCNIPSTATALSMNVTALNATADGFLTFWPAGDRPNAASLNPSPGQPPVPNAVTTTLSPTGAFRMYNENGRVDVVFDVDGYYIATSLAELDDRVAVLETKIPEIFYQEGSPNLALTSTPKVVATIFVNAKTTGRYVITASGYTDFGTNGFDSATCAISLEPNVIDADAAVVVNDSGVVASSQTVPFSTTRMFDVSPGTDAYYLVCRENNGAVAFFNPVIVAQFGLFPAP